MGMESTDAAYNRRQSSRAISIMPVSAALTPAHQRRLARLAKLAGCLPQELLDDVFKYGFEFVEEDIRETSFGLAQIEAGETVPHEEVMRNAKRIVEAARTRKHDGKTKQAA